MSDSKLLTKKTLQEYLKEKQIYYWEYKNYLTKITETKRLRLSNGTECVFITKKGIPYLRLYVLGESLEIQIDFDKPTLSSAFMDSDSLFILLDDSQIEEIISSRIALSTILQDPTLRPNDFLDFYLLTEECSREEYIKYIDKLWDVGKNSYSMCIMDSHSGKRETCSYSCTKIDDFKVFVISNNGTSYYYYFDPKSFQFFKIKLIEVEASNRTNIQIVNKTSSYIRFFPVTKKKESSYPLVLSGRNLEDASRTKRKLNELYLKALELYKENQELKKYKLFVEKLKEVEGA